ncbi:PAAR-like domain-containing protein [Enhygromyxa salina]|nr:PAAR-like domain-containing protein [Enhygromyxa salina]
MAIACKAGSAKVVSAFPSVCPSPPGPPSGPVPVPYPVSSSSRDLKRGSKQVEIGGKPVALQGQSFYQSKPLGNEAATRNFGASLVTHQVAGKTQFSSGSIDVKVEGKKVCRHLDMTTSNHGSAPGEGPSPGLETMSGARPDGPLDKCPCCKGPLHANQFDPDTGEAYEPIDELEWYKVALDYHENKVAGIGAFLAKRPGWATQIDARTELPNQAKIDSARDQLDKTRRDFQRLVDAQGEDPPCPNLTTEPENAGCRTHLKKTNPVPRTSDPDERRRLGISDGVKHRCINAYRALGHECSLHSEVCHKTPLAAGGCPNHPPNLIPKDVLSGPCAELDNAQTRLQGLAAELHSK